MARVVRFHEPGGPVSVLPLFAQSRHHMYGEQAVVPARAVLPRPLAVSYVRGGLAGGTLTPAVDRTFDLEDIVAAHRYLEAGAQVGKIVVTVARERGTQR